jgi:hypothetical protein
MPEKTLEQLLLDEIARVSEIRAACKKAPSSENNLAIEMINQDISDSRAAIATDNVDEMKFMLETLKDWVE